MLVNGASGSVGSAAVQLAHSMGAIVTGAVSYTHLYEGDLWLRSASHSNAMAARLRAGIEKLVAEGRGEGITLPFPTQSNVVFPTLPVETKARAHAAFHFYDWPGDPTLVRLMCSFDSTEADVDALLAVIAGE